jgi:class 3 adenylate cyclase
VTEEQRVQRRLAAILAADVVGYSALMERDEEATYAEFERLERELIEPSLSRHEGRLRLFRGSPLASGAGLVFLRHLAVGRLIFPRARPELGDKIRRPVNFPPIKGFGAAQYEPVGF